MGVNSSDWIWYVRKTLLERGEAMQRHEDNEAAVVQNLCDVLSTLGVGFTTESTCGKYGRVDLVTDNEVIEVKRITGWKGGVGQVLVYSLHWPDKEPRLHLWGSTDETKRPLIEDACDRLGVTVSFSPQFTWTSKDSKKTAMLQKSPNPDITGMERGNFKAIKQTTNADLAAYWSINCHQNKSHWTKEWCFPHYRESVSYLLPWILSCTDCRKRVIITSQHFLNKDFLQAKCPYCGGYDFREVKYPLFKLFDGPPSYAFLPYFNYNMHWNNADSSFTTEDRNYRLHLKASFRPLKEEPTRIYNFSDHKPPWVDEIWSGGSRRSWDIRFPEERRFTRIHAIRMVERTPEQPPREWIKCGSTIFLAQEFTDEQANRIFKEMDPKAWEEDQLTKAVMEGMEQGRENLFALNHSTAKEEESVDLGEQILDK